MQTHIEALGVWQRAGQTASVPRDLSRYVGERHSLQAQMTVRQAWDAEFGAWASSVGRAGWSELFRLLETTHLKEQCWAGFVGEQLG